MKTLIIGCLCALTGCAMGTQGTAPVSTTTCYNSPGSTTPLVYAWCAGDTILGQQDPATPGNTATPIKVACGGCVPEYRPGEEECFTCQDR